MKLNSLKKPAFTHPLCIFEHGEKLFFRHSFITIIIAIVVDGTGKAAANILTVGFHAFWTFGCFRKPDLFCVHLWLEANTKFADLAAVAKVKFNFCNKVGGGVEIVGGMEGSMVR